MADLLDHVKEEGMAYLAIHLPIDTVKADVAEHLKKKFNCEQVHVVYTLEQEAELWYMELYAHVAKHERYYDRKELLELFREVYETPHIRYYEVGYQNLYDDSENLVKTVDTVEFNLDMQYVADKTMSMMAEKVQEIMHSEYYQGVIQNTILDSIEGRVAAILEDSGLLNDPAFKAATEAAIH